jgi:large subunit ribosomal protein L6
MEKKRYFETKIEIPEKNSITIEDRVLKVKGEKGTVERKIKIKMIEFEIKDKEIILFGEKNTKTIKKLILTFRAHIRNMIRGSNESHTYKLKICSGHFPMSVSVKGDKFELKNFIGEAKPRTLTIIPDVTVKVDGQIITIESIDKEKAGQVASRIELLTRRPNFDRRVFQDGIYIIEKDGKLI